MGLFKVDEAEIERCAGSLSAADENNADSVLDEIRPIVSQLAQGELLMPQLETLVRNHNSDRAAKLLKASPRGKKLLGLSTPWVLLFPIIFVGAGIYLAIQGNLLAELAAASVSWPSVPGEVSEASISSHTSKSNNNNSRTTYWAADVEYTYEVEGKSYTNATVTFDVHGSVHGSGAHVQQSFNQKSDAEAVIARYPVGKSVKVFFDPNDPEVSVLEPGGSGEINTLQLLAILFILLGGVGAPIFLFFMTRKKSKKKKKKKKKRSMAQ